MEKLKDNLYSILNQYEGVNVGVLAGEVLIEFGEKVYKLELGYTGKNHITEEFNKSYIEEMLKDGESKNKGEVELVQKTVSILTGMKGYTITEDHKGIVLLEYDNEVYMMYFKDTGEEALRWYLEERE